ncbi:MAG: polyprenyl synthetase family protein, partial [Armatimonadetes bacterium]|nr:polyprenyl synthetase family protein [Armatimonadota bacterium]
MLRSVPLPAEEPVLPSPADLFAVVGDELTHVDDELARYAGEAPELASAMLQHTLRAGGKRIRPALVLIATQAAGGGAERAVGAAAAIELIHTATLVHDDVIDEADLRRGRPSAPRLWGNEI